MINTGYLKYIPEDKQEEAYKSLVRDIYYFYYGVRLTDDDTIICFNENKNDLSKDNLHIVKK